MNSTMAATGFVGFSLGDTNSMVALCSNDGKTHVIANEEGDRAIPSVLSFDGDEIFHGTEARKRLISHPYCTFSGFVDEFFCCVAPDCPSNGEAEQDQVLGTINFTIEDLMRHHIIKLKECAENYTGDTVHGCVISIPGSASKSKQGEFVKLVKDCGFSVVQLVNEASCCLIAYEAYGERNSEEGFDAVLDLSGSKCSISLFKPNKGKYGLIAFGSNAEISGSKLDILLRDYLVALFKKENNLDIPPGKALSRLQQEAEAARITLSSSAKATISVDSLFGNCDLHTTITKLRLDMIYRTFYRELGDYIASFLKDNGLDYTDIKTVALCGGVANTPKITSIVQSILSASKFLSPAESYDVSAFTMEACARGAALQGSLLSSVPAEDLSHYLDTTLQFTVPSSDIYMQIAGVEQPVFLYGKESPLNQAVTREVTIDTSEIEFKISEGHWDSVPGSVDEGEDDEVDDNDETQRSFTEDKVILMGTMKDLPVNESLLVKLYSQDRVSLEIFAGRQLVLGKTFL